VGNARHQVGVAFYPNFSNEDIRNWYSHFEFTPASYNGKCMSLWMTVYIFPDGTVRPCESMNFSAGNIRDQKFTEIWNNPKFVGYREDVVPEFTAKAYFVPMYAANADSNSRTKERALTKLLRPPNISRNEMGAAVVGIFLSTEFSSSHSN